MALLSDDFRFAQYSFCVLLLPACSVLAFGLPKTMMSVSQKCKRRGG